MKEILTDHGMVARAEIIKFADDFGVTFPLVYLDLLSKHNGLQFVENKFEYLSLNNEPEEAEFGFCGFGGWPVNDGIDKFQDHDVYGHPAIIVFGLSGSGNYICFDYRQDPSIDNPSIVLMYHDQYMKDESGQPKMAIAKIADNFESFIDMLHE